MFILFRKKILLIFLYQRDESLRSVVQLRNTYIRQVLSLILIQDSEKLHRMLFVFIINK